MGYGIFLCLGGLVVTLGAEGSGRKWLIRVAKPLAAAGYVTVALSVGALDSPYGRWLLAALLLCWLGDVLLIEQDREGWFVAGLGSFVAAHVLYAVAFAHRGAALRGLLIAAAVMALFATVVLRWLGPHLPQRLRWPVRAYVAAISMMAVVATSAAVAAGEPRILVGALLFLVSDLAVAHHAFIDASVVDRYWGLPLYFIGQLLLAATAGGGA